ncbi:hypothetical protein GLOTRDRAFT_117639 [Gloeophyllum trabeum ATCC 11539]|uniref:Uncharacterized protein n=1 Tax=Gloeophyllum trabeum (strain ATCC 11539 / FP-39264 / Madison 617) TaxID=670483 RepID=S7RHV9_GLOTA|nr:uncharacterized protein GLOTRDRAFT_117639 [Gloeophyllum trabeum ATCC 11539]EPQ52184.1 hypothetical protein GLOTRDRAFT_117639 [Gloeophyllum trabeum ATCC 11539]
MGPRKLDMSLVCTVCAYAASPAPVCSSLRNTSSHPTSNSARKDANSPHYTLYTRWYSAAGSNGAPGFPERPGGAHIQTHPLYAAGLPRIRCPDTSVACVFM